MRNEAYLNLSTTTKNKRDYVCAGVVQVQRKLMFASPNPSVPIRPQCYKITLPRRIMSLIVLCHPPNAGASSPSSINRYIQMQSPSANHHHTSCDGMYSLTVIAQPLPLPSPKLIPLISPGSNLSPCSEYRFAKVWKLRGEP